MVAFSHQMRPPEGILEMLSDIAGQEVKKLKHPSQAKLFPDDVLDEGDEDVESGMLPTAQADNHEKMRRAFSRN